VWRHARMINADFADLPTLNDGVSPNPSRVHGRDSASAMIVARRLAPPTFLRALLLVPESRVLLQNKKTPSSMTSCCAQHIGGHYHFVRGEVAIFTKTLHD
jgi:hypothetical protein